MYYVPVDCSRRWGQELSNWPITTPALPVASNTRRPFRQFIFPTHNARKEHPNLDDYYSSPAIFQVNKNTYSPNFEPHHSQHHNMTTENTAVQSSPTSSPPAKRVKLETTTTVPAAPTNTTTTATANTMASIPLQIKRLSEKARLPTRGSAFAAGYDIYSSKATVVPARGKALIDTDISMACPAGTCMHQRFTTPDSSPSSTTANNITPHADGRIAPRSGLASKVRNLYPLQQLCLALTLPAALHRHRRRRHRRRLPRPSQDPPLQPLRNRFPRRGRRPRRPARPGAHLHPRRCRGARAGGERAWRRRIWVDGWFWRCCFGACGDGDYRRGVGCTK